MLVLLKVFPQSSSWSGQNIFENLKDSEKISNCRVHASEIQAQNKRNMKLNSSTQTDIFNPDIMDVKKDQSDQGSRSFCDHKPFPNNTLRVDSHRNTVHSCHSNSEHSLSSFSPETYGDRGYGVVDLDNRRLPYEPTENDCMVVETAFDKGHGTKHSGGTWPKVMVNISATETEKFSVYKKPKQRKSIFDPDTFKRPPTPPKLEYLSPNQVTGHSPQPSKAEVASTPPTPPKRSDSIKFKHKQQASSASESTVTTGSPPTSPATAQAPVSLALKQDSATLKGRSRNAGNYYREEGIDCTHLSSRKSCEDDIGFQRVEEPEIKRPRPKSAPALRHKMTPMPIPNPALQVKFCYEHLFFCFDMSIFRRVFVYPVTYPNWRNKACSQNPSPLRSYSWLSCCSITKYKTTEQNDRVLFCNYILIFSVFWWRIRGLSCK